MTIEPVLTHDLELARYAAKIDDMVEKGLALGLVSQAEVDRFNASVERAAAQDAFFAYHCMIMTVGVVP